MELNGLKYSRIEPTYFQQYMAYLDATVISLKTWTANTRNILDSYKGRLTDKFLPVVQQFFRDSRA